MGALQGWLGPMNWVEGMKMVIVFFTSTETINTIVNFDDADIFN